jgi:hypothetical protein
MIKEVKYTSIKELMSRILRHPLLQEYTLEQAISHVLEFIGNLGFPELYNHKEATIKISDYKGKLPCDLIEIEMVKDNRTNLPLRKMTAVFNPGGKYYNHLRQEPQYKTQNSTIFTSFPEGVIDIAYKAIPVDDEGYPLLIDNSKFLKALELYVKCQLFTTEFERGKVNAQVLQHTEQEYDWAIGKLSSEFKVPSPDEMESISNILSQRIYRTHEFDNRFESLGNREHILIH